MIAEPLPGAVWLGECLMKTIVNLFEVILGSDEATKSLGLGAVAVRAVVLYAFGLVLVRLGKSRLMANSTALDVVVLIVLGSLLSRGINGSASVSSTMMASIVLVVCHWLLTSATARYHTVGTIVKGHARVLVADGQVDEKAIRHSHLSREDLQEGMRLNANVEDPAFVHRVYKERNGQISVVRQTPSPQVREEGRESMDTKPGGI
jgi:uncharacterized membrane protein YcaP (DUF421 family)